MKKLYTIIFKVIIILLTIHIAIVLVRQPDDVCVVLALILLLTLPIQLSYILKHR